MFNACLMSMRIAHIIKMTNYRKMFLQKPFTISHFTKILLKISIIDQWHNINRLELDSRFF